MIWARRHWFRSWVASRLRAFEETRVVDLGDADDPAPRVVVGFDGSLTDDAPPIRYEFGSLSPGAVEAFRERVRFGRLVWSPPPAEVSCVFCPEPATEEIFVGWANRASAADGPPIAHFARVCINHVGHSRFTRSDRPVDEL